MRMSNRAARLGALAASIVAPCVVAAPALADQPVERLRFQASPEGVLAIDDYGDWGSVRFLPFALSRGDAFIALPPAKEEIGDDGAPQFHAGPLRWSLRRTEAGTVLRMEVKAALGSGKNPLVVLLRADGSATFRTNDDAVSAHLVKRAADGGVRVTHARSSDNGGRALATAVTAPDGDLSFSVSMDKNAFPVTVDAMLDAASWTADGGQEFAFLGVSVAGNGDVNGDATADIVVGAFQYDDGQEDEGQALAYYGSAAGLPPSASWTAQLDQAGAYMGRRVAIVGDVDGDGLDDVAAAATDWDGAFVREGRVVLYRGRAALGLETEPSWSITGGQAGATLGLAIAPAGDIDGDGYADLLVAAPNWDGDATDAGRVELYMGSPSGLELVPAWSFTGTYAGELLGLGIAGEGDVDGDGYADILVGAPRHRTPIESRGRVYLFRGGPSGPSLTPDWFVDGQQADALFGASVGFAGDVDGDGLDDVLVTARLEDSPAVDEGVTRLYAGSNLTPGAAPLWIHRGGQAGASSGIVATGIGDVNRDGYGDLAIGAFLWDAEGDASAVDHGRVDVFLGTPDGPRDEPAFSAAGTNPDSRLGYSLADAGDVNADGWEDLVVGAHYYESTERDEGRAIVYYGPLISPPPPVGSSLTVTKVGDDIRLTWLTPATEEGAGPVLFYQVRRHGSPAGEFATIAVPRIEEYFDRDAALPSPGRYFYLVESGNSLP